jgi:hypothetical protein
MQNRMTSRSRPRPGDTLPAQETGDAAARKPVPRLPNERDESADSQSAQEPSAKRVGRTAHDDLKQGRVDTGKGPVMERTYEKVKRPS